MDQFLGNPQNGRILTLNVVQDSGAGQFLHSMHGTFTVHTKTVKHARLTDGKITDVGHLLNLPFRFGPDLTHFEREQHLQFPLAGTHCITNLPHKFAASRCRPLLSLSFHFPQITEISIDTSRGSCAACTVSRAGRISPKYLL